MKTIIGTPVHRDGAYILDKFLDNQWQIQKHNPDCQLVLCTEDTEYMNDLKSMIRERELRGVVILHKPDKPAYAKDRVWNIASGREAIRRYFLSQSDADRLLFLDADMTCDPAVLDVLERQIINYDALFSGYRFKNGRTGLMGAGCFYLSRAALEKIKFRCYEFKNGQVIYEDNTAEMDLFRTGCRIKKSFFLAIDHYSSPAEARHIDPQKVGLYRRLTTNSLVRFCLIRTSVAIHYNIPSTGQKVLWYFMQILDRFNDAKTKRFLSL